VKGLEPSTSTLARITS